LGHRVDALACGFCNLFERAGGICVNRPNEFIAHRKARGLLLLPDQESATLVLVQVKLLDGYGLGALAIGRFDRAEVFAAAAYDDDAPASQIGELFGVGTPGHVGKIMAAGEECESPSLLPICYPICYPTR
jgi:hypothetical protein